MESLLARLGEGAAQVGVLELAADERAHDLGTKQRDGFGLVFRRERNVDIEWPFRASYGGAQAPHQRFGRTAADQRGGRPPPRRAHPDGPHAARASCTAPPNACRVKPALDRSGGAYVAMMVTARAARARGASSGTGPS